MDGSLVCFDGKVAHAARLLCLQLHGLRQPAVQRTALLAKRRLGWTLLSTMEPQTHAATEHAKCTPGDPHRVACLPARMTPAMAHCDSQDRVRGQQAPETRNGC